MSWADTHGIREDRDRGVNRRLLAQSYSQPERLITASSKSWVTRRRHFHVVLDGVRLARGPRWPRSRRHWRQWTRHGPKLGLEYLTLGLEYTTALQKQIRKSL